MPNVPNVPLRFRTMSKTREIAFYREAQRGGTEGEVVRNQLGIHHLSAEVIVTVFVPGNQRKGSAMVHKGQTLVGIACFLLVASLAEASASTKGEAAIDASKIGNTDDDGLRHMHQQQTLGNQVETASNHTLADVSDKVDTLALGQTAFW